MWIIISLLILGGSQNLNGQRIVYQIAFGQADNCQGKDTGNYTIVLGFTADSTCQQVNFEPDAWTMILENARVKRAFVPLRTLTYSRHQPGAYSESYWLFLVTGGPMQGKFILYKIYHLRRDYLKKCSSVLGLSFIPTTEWKMMIMDKLDSNLFITPPNCYENAKKQATTICDGTFYNI